MSHAPYLTQRRTELMASRQFPLALHPVVKRVLASRISDLQELDLGLGAIPDPDTIRDMRKGVRRIARAMTQSQRIVIAGDYDADGATSTSVLVLGLRAMGAQNVHWHVPDRFKLGYGLTPGLVKVIAAEKHPALIVTVDNGISSHEGVNAAREAGIDVVVTDHHLPGEDGVPGAWAVIDPNRSDDTSGLGALAGVGVAFFLLCALRRYLETSGWFKARKRPNLGTLLDLVALGTVADVVPLDHVNRVLVNAGLKRIRAGRCRPGITALMSIAGKIASKASATDMGFCIGPRINASGRLDDIGTSIRCLLTDNHSEAAEYADKLDRLNRERREIEASMGAGALEIIKKTLATLKGEIPQALTLYDPQWHEGVVGLVAGRAREQYHRPVAAFAPGVNEMLKGSVRSIPGVHARDVLVRIETLHPGLIAGFGGHAAAAGLSLPPSSLEEFREAFCAATIDIADPGAFVRTILTDGELEPGEIDLNAAQAIAESGPWGRGFPSPLFEGGFVVRRVRMLSGGAHASMEIESEDGTDIDAKVMAFNLERLDWSPAPGPVRMVYELLADEWQGVVKPMIRVEAIL